MCGKLSVYGSVLDEWAFYSDPAGRTLSQAFNSAGGASFSVFSGTEAALLTDGAGKLICTQNDSGSTTGMWTNGAVLDAAQGGAVTSGVRYLRYDFSYNLNDPVNNSGCTAGFSFYDETGTNVAGMALLYDVGAGASPLYDVVDVCELTADTGTVSVVAAVDLSNQTLSVWYSLTGDVSGFNPSSPATNVTVLISSFNSLRFQSTGDIRPDGSDDYVAVDLLRTADTWEDILLPDPAAAPVIEIGVVDSQSGSMDIGDTNVISVVMRNRGGLASNVTAAISHDGALSAFTFLSSNVSARTIWPGQSTTNTFTVTANTNGTYLFTVDGLVNGVVNASTNFTLTVGSHVGYLTNSVAVVSTNGLLSGQYEPEEILDVTIISTNDGAKAVSNVVNSLSSSSAYFSISNLNTNGYAYLPVGAATSTVYRVTVSPSATNGVYSFTVTNRTDTRVWADSFSLSIFKQSIPSLSAGSLLLQAVEGYTSSAQIIVSNAGNDFLQFSVTDSAVWDEKQVVNTNTTVSAPARIGAPLPLNSPGAYLRGESDTISIGFGFPFYGSTYSNLYIDANGAIILSTSNRVGNLSVADNSTGPLPLGSRPLMAPFRSRQLLISTDSPVRYTLTNNPVRLVLTFTNVTLSAYPSSGTNLSYQAELFEDGRVKFSYYNMNGSGLSNVTVGVQSGTGESTNVNLVPASGRAVLIGNEVVRWVTYSPVSGAIAPLGSTAVTFTADASGQSAGTSNRFDAVFSWPGLGTFHTVDVQASVVEAQPLLVSPSNVLFFGNAGDIAASSFIISNAGTAALDFVISDTNAAGTVYSGAAAVSTNWTDISLSGTRLQMLDPDPNPYISETNEGFSALMPIGFSFPFYGGVYAQFSAGVNGGISLGTTNRMSAGLSFSTSRTDVPQQFVAPYWGNLLMDEQSGVYFLSTNSSLIVSWVNLRQPGAVAGTNLSFQAVLYADGRIEFRYRQINGYNWPLTRWGIRSGSAQSVSGSLVLPADVTFTAGPVVTGYVSAASNRQVSLTASNYPVISYSPDYGRLEAGESVQIELGGNAAGQTPGGSNTLTNRLQMNIVYDAGTNTVQAGFVVTNSVESAMASPLADALFDEDGDGMTYDQELIAGTDPLDQQSVFSVSTASGNLLSWTAAAGRTYTVWYTLNLQNGFQQLPGASGLATNVFKDELHAGVSVIYYKVTVD